MHASEVAPVDDPRPAARRHGRAPRRRRGPSAYIRMALIAAWILQCAICCAWARDSSESGAYVVSGAGDEAADGTYRWRSDTMYAAASGMELFFYQNSWYIGKYGSGPVLYKGACPTKTPPQTWTTYTWKGVTAASPVPSLSTSAGAPPPLECRVCNGYTITGAGSADVNGCYERVSHDKTLFNHTSSSFALYRETRSIRSSSEGQWVISKSSNDDKVYVSTCLTSKVPPAMHGWQPVAAGRLPVPALSATDAFPLGYCPPVPPPSAKPHPRCSTPECIKLWGTQGCPDLNTIDADLVRPPMQDAVPAAGVRARVVAPGFEDTQAYHPLYLPSDWSQPSGVGDTAKATKYPVIVEYMGNGPFNDGYGDISTGRPEDSNLGWGMADPAGSKYIWISMPFLSADLGNNTEISTYWWGCPTTDASRPCGSAFDISPTIRYLHAALQQTFDHFGGDPQRVVMCVHTFHTCQQVSVLKLSRFAHLQCSVAYHSTGWSRGAIATGAIGLYDDATSRLFRAFVPYSHLDGDCGWVDMQQPAYATASRPSDL